MMRSVLVASLLGFAIVLIACGLTSPDERHIKLTFVNSTDSLLCFNSYEVDFCATITPRDTSIWRPGCGLAGEQRLTFFLSTREGRREFYRSTREGRREIYRRTATCNEWEDAGATFIIKQRGDELVVTDSLPDGTSSP